MHVGDIVTTVWSETDAAARSCGFSDNDIPCRYGIVIGVEPWVDKGAPDRNFGVIINVLWPDGTYDEWEDCELEIVSSIPRVS